MYDYPSPSGKYLSLIHEQHYYRLKRYASDGIRGMYHCGKPWFMNSLFQYVVSRLGWNPSLDTDALTREFVADYYGPAAPKIIEIYTMLTQAAAREDRPQFGTKQLSFVTIPECERILSLFGEAEALAGPSGVYRDRVTGEKAFALYSYLCIKNPVLGNTQNLKAFTAHLRELLDIAINKPTNHWFVVRAGRGAKRKDAFQDFLWTVARVKVGPGMPMEDPIIAELMKDNEFDIAKHITVVKPETLGGNKGWRIPLDLFTGAGIPKMYKWKCPPRRGIVLRTQFFDEHTMTATFDLTDDVDGKWKLMLDGQNHDKLTPGAEFAVSVNGKEIFRGQNPFVRQGWSSTSYEIPASVLKQTGNTISITDLADGDVLFVDWLIIADVRIERP
jgi:hypothetical protein